MIVVEEEIVAMIVEGGDENKKQVDCYVFLA